MKTLNEISARTLRSYRDKALHDREKIGQRIDAHHDAGYEQPENRAESMKKHKDYNKQVRKFVNRTNGMRKAGEKLYLRVVEDAIAVNNIGGGAIAGAGIGKDGEPGVPKRKRLRVILNKARMLTRRKPNG